MALLLLGLAGVVLATILIVSWLRSRLVLPSGDILFSVPEDDFSKWGLLTLESGKIEYLTSSLDEYWEFPRVSRPIKGVLFRYRMDSLGKGPMYEFGSSAPEVAFWKEGAAPLFCEEAFESGRLVWSDRYHGVIVVPFDHPQIVAFDPTTCTQTQVVFDIADFSESFIQYGSEDELYVVYPTLSEDDFLAFAIGAPSDPSPSDVIIFDLSRTQIMRVIEDATHPVWSQDGSMLSYIAPDGIYVTDRLGTSIVKISDYEATWRRSGYGAWKVWLPYAEWSPDETALTYHRVISERVGGVWSDFNVYVYDLGSKTERLVAENAMNPSWILR